VNFIKSRIWQTVFELDNFSFSSRNRSQDQRKRGADSLELHISSVVPSGCALRAVPALTRELFARALSSSADWQMVRRLSITAAVTPARTGQNALRHNDDDDDDDDDDEWSLTSCWTHNFRNHFCTRSIALLLTINLRNNEENENTKTRKTKSKHKPESTNLGGNSSSSCWRW